MAPRKRKANGSEGSRKKRRTKADYEGESIPARAPGRAYTEIGRPQRTTRAMRNADHPHFDPNYTYEFRDDPDRPLAPLPAHPGSPEQPEVLRAPEDTGPPVTPDRPIVNASQPVPSTRRQSGRGSQSSSSTHRSPFHSSPPIPSSSNLSPVNNRRNRSPVASSPRDPSVGNLSAANFSPIASTSPAHFPPIGDPSQLSPGRLSNSGDLPAQTPGNSDAEPSNHSSSPSDAGSSSDKDGASPSPEPTPSEAGRMAERIGRQEWWFSHMEALSAPRRAGVIIRRARRIHAMPPTNSLHDQVLRDNMLRMMRESVETHVPEDRRPRVWRVLNNDEAGDDESRAGSDHEGSYEDWDEMERALEENEDEEMTQADEEQDDSSDGDDDFDNLPDTPGSSGGSNHHGSGGSGQGPSGSSSRHSAPDTPSHTSSPGSPQTTGNQALGSTQATSHALPNLAELAPQTRRRLEHTQALSPAQMQEEVLAWEEDLRHRLPPISPEDVHQQELERRVVEHQRREAERLVEEHDAEAHFREEVDAALGAIPNLPDDALDYFHIILALPRGREQLDAIVSRARMLERLPRFSSDGWPNGDPAATELRALRTMVPVILPDDLVVEAMQGFAQGVDRNVGPVEWHFGDIVPLRVMQEDIDPVVLTDEDIQRNESEHIRDLVSRPRAEEREREILKRARVVRGRYMRQQELRGRFPNAALNDEWRHWILEWQAWKDDISTLVPGTDLWFQVDRILDGSDEHDDQTIADQRHREALDVIVRVEQTLPDYAFPQDRLPDRMSDLFQRIIVSRTADARARRMISRAFQLRGMEWPARDDPRGLEMALLRRMAEWLLPPRLMGVVMPVLRGEVEEDNAPDLTSTSDDEAPVPRPSWAPEAVGGDDVESLPDYVSDPEPEPTQAQSNATTLRGRDPAEVAAAAFGINLNGPRAPPPVVRGMPIYDAFDARERKPLVDGYFSDEQRSPSPGPVPHFPFSAQFRKQLREEAEQRASGTVQGGEEGGDGTGGVE